MRKDSEMFLKKVLVYRNEMGKDSFEINIKYFSEIPNIVTVIGDILNDLKWNNCISSKSEVCDLEGNIALYLTLDGILYFNDIEKPDASNRSMRNNKGISYNRETDKLNESETNVITTKGSDEDGKRRKVFISYSWTPESNKKWVEQLVDRLEMDGVDVIVDYKNLKLGNDKYAFMERMVSDESVSKVLIICNKTYKEKADERSGGVGDESTIITPKVYGNANQEKFIPIVNEHDGDGRPYLPNYLASRMYADLVEFNSGYSLLLESILDDKIHNQIGRDRNSTYVNISWEIDNPIVNDKCIHKISELKKDINLLGSVQHKNQFLVGKEALNIHIWKFMNTEKYKYRIYSEAYGTEYTEFLKTTDEKVFRRLAPLVARELLESDNFREWINVIYGFRRIGNKLLLDYGVKGNEGKIITINLLWKCDGSDVGGLEIGTTS